MKLNAFLCSSLLALSVAVMPTWAAAGSKPTNSVLGVLKAVPATPPGQVQPVAPNTLAAPKIPLLKLVPSIPEVRKVEYLSNGYIEVAGAVLTVAEGDRPRARALAGYAARRILATRPQLDEVDVSVYDRGSYAGFGGPLPILTASVPRLRLEEFLNWADGHGSYDRAWVNAKAPTPPIRQPDTVRELTVNFLGALADRAADAVHHTTAKVLGGVQGGLLYHGSARQPLTALTFDDAPHPMYEPLLLDLLRRADARATFFVIGRNARAYPYFVRDMAEQGHEVANHTYHHVRLPGLPIAEATAEMQEADAVLQGITGKPVRYFRPPGGDYTPATLRAAEALGLTTVFWTDDPGDFQNPGDNVLLERYTRMLRRGGIVLLHDNAPEMLQVLPAFLRLAVQHRIDLNTVGTLVAGPDALIRQTPPALPAGRGTPKPAAP
ncbi:polysaccharide deacetylase family protein [Deinococcus ruber]|uniref:polysaccharide deacetylase family protein n=1 Tax=Deinococcus ruber TaxID=1848197 RepID=UPI001E4A0FBF|nr:polysaccharide deacetylase family protein [Deinococcus ruber]